MWIRPAAVIDAAALLGSGVGTALVLGVRRLWGSSEARPVESRPADE